MGTGYTLDERMVLCYTLYMRQKSTVYFDETDRAAIQAIKEDNGLNSDADAIRFALRQTARKTMAKKKGVQNAQKL